MRRYKRTKHKRRLAHARSGLITGLHDYGRSMESAYWSFPLPPISPSVLKQADSLTHVELRPSKRWVQVLPPAHRLCPSPLPIASARQDSGASPPPLHACRALLRYKETRTATPAQACEGCCFVLGGPQHVAVRNRAVTVTSTAHITAACF